MRVVGTLNAPPRSPSILPTKALSFSCVTSVITLWAKLANLSTASAPFSRVLRPQTATQETAGSE